MQPKYWTCALTIAILGGLAGCGEVVEGAADASLPGDALAGSDAASDAAGPDAATAPNTTLTATPPDPDNQAMPQFMFTSDRPGSTFQCKLDNGSFAACSSPHPANVTGEGSHTFEVFASNGGVDDPTPASHTWTLDQTLPSLTITSAPPLLTASSTASFTFSAEAGASVECRLNAAPFAACDSSTAHTLTGVPVGTHTFEVRARDTANNDAVASHTWTVEPPCNEVVIEAESLTNTGWGIASGSVLSGGQALDTSTVSNSFTFPFQGKGLVIYYRKGPGAGSHSVSIDGGPAVNISATDSVWSYQNPTTVATGLVSGNHSVEVTCTASNCQVDYFRATCN